MSCDIAHIRNISQNNHVKTHIFLRHFKRFCVYSMSNESILHIFYVILIIFFSIDKNIVHVLYRNIKLYPIRKGYIYLGNIFTRESSDQIPAHS